MPRVHDRALIRSILETDRPWAVYALGDLGPELMLKCSWHAAMTARPALAVLYRGFATPVLFTLGQPEDVQPLLVEVADEPALYLSVRPEIVSLIEAAYHVDWLKPMWRMVLNPDGYRPAGGTAVSQLGTPDVTRLQRLYRDGAATGEEPDFFHSSMVADGTFFGISEARELIAAAGTHLVVPAEGVAAIGNVYTRRDRRGRGLAAAVTSAVVEELRRRQVPTIALNVAQANHRAIGVYERLGFARYASFCEGFVRRRKTG